MKPQLAMMAWLEDVLEGLWSKIKLAIGFSYAK